jgi:hypothetical protein
MSHRQRPLRNEVPALAVVARLGEGVIKKVHLTAVNRFWAGGTDAVITFAE